MTAFYGAFCGWHELRGRLDCHVIHKLMKSRNGEKAGGHAEVGMEFLEGKQVINENGAEVFGLA